MGAFIAIAVVLMVVVGLMRASGNEKDEQRDRSSFDSGAGWASSDDGGLSSASTDSGWGSTSDSGSSGSDPSPSSSD